MASSEALQVLGQALRRKKYFFLFCAILVAVWVALGLGLRGLPAPSHQPAAPGIQAPGVQGPGGETAE
jgi:hypothetical protein